MGIRASGKGDRPPRDLADHEIEDRATRDRMIDEGEKKYGKGTVGVVCVSVEPGERLGELYVNTQYEARPGDHDGCQRGQNEYMVRGADWLRTLIDTIAADGTDWQVDVYSVPCPKTSLAPPVERAVDVLHGARVEADVKPGVEGVVEQRAEVER